MHKALVKHYISILFVPFTQMYYPSICTSQKVLHGEPNSLNVTWTYVVLKLYAELCHILTLKHQWSIVVHLQFRRHNPVMSSRLTGRGLSFDQRNHKSGALLAVPNRKWTRARVCQSEPKRQVSEKYTS